MWSLVFWEIDQNEVSLCLKWKQIWGIKTYFPFELSSFVLVLIKTFWSISHKTCHFASQVNVFLKSLDICTGKQDKITEEERQLFAAWSDLQ